MQKIPVAETVEHVYGLSFRRYLTVAGIVWLPMVVLFALMFAIMRPLTERLSVIFSHMGQTGAPPDIGDLNAWVWLINIVNFFVLAMMASGITKEVLGRRTGPRFVYLQFGRAEWTVLGNFVLLYIALIVVMIAAVLVGAILSGIGAVVVSASGQQNTVLGRAEIGIFAVGVFFIVGIAALYVAVRLGFFAVPVSVAENRIALFRSWELTRGNVWRIVGILVATLLPLIIAEAVIVGVMLYPLVAGLAGAVGKGHAAMGVVLAGFYGNMWRVYPYAAVPGLLLAPIFYGLFMSSPAFAYRALVADAPAAAPSA